MANRGNAGKGRPKGSPNKITARVREAIVQAAENHGRDGKGKDGLTGYLTKLAAEEPRAFASLLGRIVPTQIEAEVDTKQDPLRQLLDNIAANGRRITDKTSVDEEESGERQHAN